MNIQRCLCGCKTLTVDVYVEGHRPRVVDDLIADTGCTCRQLDHWVRRGYLRPDNTGGGHGTRRDWSEGEVQVAARMRRLVGAGFHVSTAARLARDPADTAVDWMGDSLTVLDVAPGIHLLMGAEPS